jgi:ABC-type multidrug transport system fused ATPase/permease subunit
MVIDGMTFKIDSKQKVGLVGRTGSGKSTFLLCMMRVLEVPEEIQEKSFIKIDGVRIDKIGLHHLRNAIEIIPQDPFLVEGTLRFNLDPMQQYSD